MIVLISEKDFVKTYKKLLKGEYGIANASEDDTLATLGAVKNSTEDFEALMPADVLTEKSGLDGYKYEKKKSAFLNKPGMTYACAVIAAMQVSHNGKIDKNERPNKNVFVVLDKKCYKYLAGDIRKRFNEILDLDKDDGPVVVEYKRLDKFMKTSVDMNEEVKDRLKKIDKKIDKLTEETEGGYIDIFDDEDVSSVEKKIKKLRKERKELAASIGQGDEKLELTDEIRRSMLKNGKISKEATKKLIKAIEHYHEIAGGANDYRKKYS